MFAKQCIANHDHPSVVNIFPAIKHLKQMSSEYSEILKVKLIITVIFLAIYCIVNSVAIYWLYYFY